MDDPKNMAKAGARKTSWLKRILLTLAILAGLLIVVVAMQPSEFLVTRTATMAAPVSAVFPHVNELKQWEAWSPWAKMDPEMKTSYEGPSAGPGAVSSWSGNHEVGKGRMTIQESRTNELIRFHLEFFEPMAGTSSAEFRFKPDGKGTTVTWSMSGKNNFIGKAMCLVMNMDKMVGGQFDQGLASMKYIVESGPKP